jgi:phosphoglycerate dehydrogenase-like enzyme
MTTHGLQALGLLGLMLASTALDAKGAPDPRAIALIQELELKASATASRDLPGWKVPTRIVVATDDARQLDALRATLPGIEILAAAQGDALSQQLATAEVAVGLCNEQTITAGKKLHWIQALHVGVERCLAVPGFAASGIVLTNMQRTSGTPIAEHAIAMLFALTRGLPHYARNQQAGHWNEDAPRDLPMRELAGRTLLVVGLGGIGTEVAHRAHGLGMRVIATRNSSREGPEYVARVGLSDELLVLAAEADVVVNAVPLTPATTNLFDRKFFDTLKPDAYFINVARGGSVVTADLVAALKSGRLAGAGLDVTEPEPLPAGHALWGLPNVIITPHVAAQSDAQNARYWIVAQENMRRYVAGEPLLNVVDPARGY